MNEKYLAAIHEAAHAALVREFGGLATIQIQRNYSGNPNEREWVGVCEILQSPWPAGDELGGRQRVQVGLAGYVAEQMARGDDDPTVIFEAFSYAVMDGEISATDLGLIGDVSQVDDVTTEEVMKLIAAKWASVELEAQRLAAATSDE